MYRVLGAALAVLLAARPGQGQCLTDTTTAGFVTEQVRALISDSTVDAGVRVMADSLQLVTASAVCDSALVAYNTDSGIAGTPAAMTELYLVKIPGYGYVLYLPGEGPIGERRLHWYDLTWHYLISML